MSALRHVLLFTAFLANCVAPSAESPRTKPGPDEALEILKAGNDRFVSGRSEHPHADASRIKLAGSASQADYAYATVLTCSDSRIPVERIFDAGVMDLFVIRVAGNVCNTDEIGSIEYGLAHVKTPVLIILGHTQCGAVTAVTQHLQGKGHGLERNIPPLVKSIQPAVQRVLRDNAGLEEKLLVSKGIEENVWGGIENLFLASPAVRELVIQDKVKVVGGIYDVGVGRVVWLPENRVHRLLGRVEVDPHRAQNAMADDDAGDSHGTPREATPAPHGAASDHQADTEPIHPLVAAARADAQAKAHGDAHSNAAPQKSGVDQHTAKDEHAAAAPAKPVAHGVDTLSSAVEHSEKSKGDLHATKGAEKSHGDPHAKSEAKEHGEADEHKDSDAVASAGDTRPWTLIAAAGVVFVLGLSVALFAYFSGKKADATAAPVPASAPAH